MNPLVSILIPAYNAERWIADTIRSALAQTWSRKEIIIVDDGSKDRTLAIAHAFASNGVKVVSQKNQGAAAARNNAFSRCQGDYIQWLDADDLLSEDKVARQMAVAEKSGGLRTLYSCAWGSFYYRPSKARFVPSRLWATLSPIEWMLRKWETNLPHVHMQTGTWLVSRELTKAAGPWDTRLLGDDDGEYFSRVIKGADRIEFVPSAKVFYRMAGASRLSYIGRSKQKMDAQFLGMKLQIDYLRSMADNPRVRAACVNYLQMWLPSFYPYRPDIVEEAQKFAQSLGGNLTNPRLSWKYIWIKALFGWKVAKLVQMSYNNYKTSFWRTCDLTLSRFESRMSRWRSLSGDV